MTYHVGVTLKYIRELSDKEIVRAVPNGMSAAQIRETLNEIKADGMTYLPLMGCNNSGPVGECLGHSNEEASK